jgi:hypothetical protein
MTNEVLHSVPSPDMSNTRPLGLSQNLANKVMINGEVLRECAHRGLQIPRSNE